MSPTDIGESTEALGCAHVWKRFGEVIANRDISLSIARGTVHAVIGENGAGKSTLMRGLYGLHSLDQGSVRIDGELIETPSVAASIKRRVGMVHQHFMLVPTLTVTENVVLGDEPVERGMLVLSRAEQKLIELGERLGLARDPALFRRRVGELSVGEAQRVEILKVLYRGAKILILDEPTAVLSPLEVDDLFAVLRRLRQDGSTIILVTHKLDEVMGLADRVTVLRRGETVLEVETGQTSAAQLAHAMVGRELAKSVRTTRQKTISPPTMRLKVESLSVRRSDGSLALDGVSFSIAAGEILGVAGVEGNGQSELALSMAGISTPERGRVRIDGQDVTALPVIARRRLGMRYVPEDRHGRGLLLDATVEDNFLLGVQEHYRRFGFVDRRRLEIDALERTKALDVRPPDLSAVARTLSGGNQQKVVIGRELAGRRDIPLSTLVCAQPTRGVDVGAIEKIHAEIERVRKDGAATLLISAELDELLALSDRIVVLFRGRIVGELEDFDQFAAGELKSRVGALMLGAA